MESRQKLHSRWKSVPSNRLLNTLSYCWYGVYRESKYIVCRIGLGTRALTACPAARPCRSSDPEWGTAKLRGTSTGHQLGSAPNEPAQGARVPPTTGAAAHRRAGLAEQAFPSSPLNQLGDILAVLSDPPSLLSHRVTHRFPGVINSHFSAFLRKVEEAP